MTDQLTSMPATMAEDTRPTERIRLFSLAGRLDRWRYVAYSLSSLVGVMVTLFVISFGLIHLGALGRTLYIFTSVLLCYGFLPIFFTILTIKRAHDFNTGGWLAVFLFIPIINLMFWFIPGTRGENRYGHTLSNPSFSTKVLAIVLSILLIVGFLATGVDQLSTQESAQPTLAPESTLKPYTP